VQFVLAFISFYLVHMGKKNRNGSAVEDVDRPDDGPVSELVYWRDPKKSGAVFGSLFLVLIFLTFASFISVVAYSSLAVLGGTLAFRVYKMVMQAVQKTNDGHPFKEYLEAEVTVSDEKAQEVSAAVLQYFNSAALKLRSLFLVEDLFDSIKFGAVLYFLTYVGSCFNGLTLIILGLITMFAAPKVYETNKTVIDQYLELAQAKYSEISAKVTAAIPFGKKDKAQ